MILTTTGFPNQRAKSSKKKNIKINLTEYLKQEIKNYQKQECELLSPNTPNGQDICILFTLNKDLHH